MILFAKPSYRRCLRIGVGAALPVLVMFSFLPEGALRNPSAADGSRDVCSSALLLPWKIFCRLIAFRCCPYDHFVRTAAVAESRSPLQLKL